MRELQNYGAILSNFFTFLIVSVNQLFSSEIVHSNSHPLVRN